MSRAHRRAHRRARRRDRRVYLRGHPVLFALLALGRRSPVRRLGRTVLVHGTDAYRDALTRLPMDRAGPGTTGGVAGALASGGVLFDQDGGAHRGTRRSLADDLGVAGVERLRPVWTALLDRRIEPLARSGTIDVVEIAAELAGATVCAMLDVGADPRSLTAAARAAAAAAVGEHLPGLRRRGTGDVSRRAAAELTDLLAAADSAAACPVADSAVGPTADRVAPALAAMLAVAAVNTTVAGLPRAVAWCADAGLWDAAADDARRPTLAGELLRVVAPSPLLPRVAARDGEVAGHPVRAGERLMLITRHAVGAHRTDPDCARPAAPGLAQLVFGAGPHACPGARLARAQLNDTLRALAPYRPVVVRARADKAAALPGWATLTIKAREGS